MTHSLDDDTNSGPREVARDRTLGALSVDAVAHLAPFEHLTREETRKLLALATQRRVVEQGSFFHEGDRADHVYLLVDGFVRIQHVTSGGDQVVMVHVGPGRMFGISKVVERDRYVATAKAASNALALCWPAALWDQITRQDISDITGTTMHSVSRCMSGWHRDGIVQSKRRRVVVCHPDDLRRVALGEAA